MKIIELQSKLFYFKVKSFIFFHFLESDKVKYSADMKMSLLTNTKK